MKVSTVLGTEEGLDVLILLIFDNSNTLFAQLYIDSKKSVMKAMQLGWC